MARSNPHDEKAADAVECFLCLNDPDADPRVRARWSAWLSADPANQDAYHRVRDTWRRPVPNDVWPTHAEIQADDYDGEGPLPAAVAAGRRPFSIATLSLATVAVALLAVVVGVSLVDRGRPAEVASESYRTARGEQRTIALPDGSSIVLGPNSALFLEGEGSEGGASGMDGAERAGAGPGSGRRAARLEAGEAVFAVVHDGAHPFTVAVNGGRVDDIGTTFSVALEKGRATVTVVDGAVRVAAPSGTESVELTRDQQVSFAARLEPARTVDGHSETDWSRGRLVYVDRPLADVVADLERYTALDIAIADPAVGDLHYTGTVETGAVDHWIAALTHLFPVKVDRAAGGGLVLRSAPKG